MRKEWKMLTRKKSALGISDDRNADGLTKHIDKRLLGCAGGFGFLLALSCVCGYRLQRDGTVLRSAGELFFLAAQVLLLTIFAALCTAWLIRFKIKHETKPEKKGEQKNVRSFLFDTGILLLCWFPVFLAYYPSVFAYDAEGQLYQVIAQDYSTHHPLIHTLFLGAFFRLGGWIGSYSAGMAVHSVVQMLLMTCAFGYALTCMRRRGISVWIRTVTLLFFALFPVNSVLVLSTTKDVLFSALVLLYVLRLLQEYGCAAQEKDQKARQKIDVPLCIIGVGMLLFRNNAVYALIVSMAGTYLVLLRKYPASVRRRYLYTTMLSLICFLGCMAGMKQMLGAQKGSPREMLSVPLQQIARTRVEHETEIEPELRQKLEQYISSEWVELYDPHLADPIKSRTQLSADPAGLIRAWVKLGIQYPQTYVDAFLDNVAGFWFLGDTSHSRIYGIGKETGFGYLSTDNRAMPAGCEILPDSKLPGLRSFMEEIVSENRYQEIPVLSLLFVPAFYFWWLALYVTEAVYVRRRDRLIPALFLLAYYATLLLSPAALVRYLYPLIVSVPVLYGLTTCRKGMEEKCGMKDSCERNSGEAEQT